MKYTALSACYDNLIGVDYDRWLRYILQVLERCGRRPKKVLDLACGSGEMAIRLARLGMDVTGVDASCHMLAVAEAKLRDGGFSCLLIQQDMRQLALPAKYDLVICCCDSLNYVLSPRALQKVFRNVGRCLRPGGLFIFDLNTCYKLANVYGTSAYGVNTPTASYILETDYDPANRICHMELTMFLPEDGLYRKFEEKHRQRAYPTRFILQALRRAGLCPLTVHDDYRFRPPRKRSERLVFTAKLAFSSGGRGGSGPTA
jgi:SAM-dependent methyltransferase